MGPGGHDHAPRYGTAATNIHNIRWGHVVMTMPLATALQQPTYITSDPRTKLYSISNLRMMENASTKERNKGN